MVTIQQIRTVLERVAFPAEKAEILMTLHRLEAPPEMIERVQHIPEYRYGSVDTVLDALRGLE